MSLNPRRALRCRGAGQVGSQQNRWGCISLLNQLLRAPARSSHCRSSPHLPPACFLACSLSIWCRIHQMSPRQPNAGCRPRAALCYPRVGCVHAGIVCVAIKRFYLVPHHGTSARLHESKGTCPGPASDRDRIAFCGCRATPTGTRPEKIGSAAKGCKA